MRLLHPFVAAAATAAALYFAGLADAADILVTPQHPGVVALDPPGDVRPFRKANAGAWLDVSLDRFQPDTAGTAVRAVVSLSNGKQSVVVGRVNFFPHVATPVGAGPDIRRLDATSAIESFGGFGTLDWNRLQARVTLEALRAGETPTSASVAVGGAALVPFVRTP